MTVEGEPAPSDPPEGAGRGLVFGFDRNLFAVGLVSFLTDTATKMVYSVMPLFLLSLGASKTTLSAIEGVAESTSALVKVAAGSFADRAGRNKPFLVVGYAITALVTPLYAAVTAPVQVLLLRFVERLGKGVRTAPRDSLVAASAPRGGAGRGFGLHKAMDNAGAIAGPLLAAGVLWLVPAGYRVIFLLAALPAALGVATVLWLVREASRPEGRSNDRFRLRDFPPRFYLLLGIVGLFTLGNSTDALLLVKASEVGIGVALIPLLYLLFNAVSVLLAIPFGSRSDRIGRGRILVFGYLVYSFVYVGFGYTRDPRVVVGLFALYGVYSAATDGVQRAFVTDLLHPQQRGTGLGLYHAVLGLMLLPASLIAGVLYDRVDASVPFYFGAATAAAAALLMALCFRQRPGLGRAGGGERGDHRIGV